MALSKGLTGGTLPLGVTACNGKIVSAFDTPDFLKTFFHGHSYTANPLACAAANASFDLLMRKECQLNIVRISEAQYKFAERLNGDKKIKSIKSLGTILSVELRTEEGTSYTSSKRKSIYQYFLDKDILLRPLGNIIYIVPPYVTSEEELAKIHTAIETFLEMD
jgi:adenosylmethionine-8-amino-7-oxononanoate aminotransferase